MKEAELLYCFYIGKGIDTEINRMHIELIKRNLYRFKKATFIIITDDIDNYGPCNEFEKRIIDCNYRGSLKFKIVKHSNRWLYDIMNYEIFKKANKDRTIFFANNYAGDSEYSESLGLSVYSMYYFMIGHIGYIMSMFEKQETSCCGMYMVDDGTEVPIYYNSFFIIDCSKLKDISETWRRDEYADVAFRLGDMTYYVKGKFHTSEDAFTTPIGMPLKIGNDEKNPYELISELPKYLQSTIRGKDYNVLAIGFNELKKSIS